MTLYDMASNLIPVSQGQGTTLVWPDDDTYDLESNWEEPPQWKSDDFLCVDTYELNQASKEISL